MGMRYSHHHNLLDKYNVLNPENIGLYSNYPLGPSWFPLREKTDLQEGRDKWFEHMGKTFFKGVNNPYAVFMGVGKIEYLELPSTILDTKSRNKFNKKGLKIYLLEPLSTYRINQPEKEGANSHYIDYELEEIDSIKVYELDSIEIFIERNDLKNVSVYTPNFKVNEYFGMKYPTMQLYCSPVGWNYPATMEVQLEIPKKEDIIKKFWCGNWKYASHRHLIASYLAGRFDTSEINLSWIYSSSPSMLQNNLWFDLKKLSKWEKEISSGAQKLDLISPQAMGVKIKRALDISEDSPNLHTNTNPKNFYNESFCAIVNETRFAEPTGFLTEKIMNPMLNCKPFIMVGPPGNLEYMHTWGFQTFSEFWDESYDKEHCHYKRIGKILGLIDELGKKSIEELRELYESMLPVTMFNQVHILDLQEKLVEEPITRNILFKRLG